MRRIPYKQFAPDEDEKKKWSAKIVVWNTKKFKMKGQTKFLSLNVLTKKQRKRLTEEAIEKRLKQSRRQDAWEYASHIDFQGMKEGWYNPSEIYSQVTTIGKQEFYEKWGKYNGVSAE